MKFRFSYMLLMAPASVISQNGELYLHTLFLLPEVVEMEPGTLKGKYQLPPQRAVDHIIP